MGKNYEFRFELKPSKFIYVPTKEATVAGKKIVNDLLQKWTPADYFYHFGKRGGHVAAMQLHSYQSFKASIDLKGFFNSVTRSKVQRALKSIGYSNRTAFEIASMSCVQAKNRKFLPYGFVQSMALATLAVEKSQLGTVLKTLRNNGVKVSVYVDDIVFSANEKALVDNAFHALVTAVEASNLTCSPEKSASAAESVNAFNCIIFNKVIEINDPRMSLFKSQLASTSAAGRDAILRYVGGINEDQMNELMY